MGDFFLFLGGEDFFFCAGLGVGGLFFLTVFFTAFLAGLDLGNAG